MLDKTLNKYIGKAIGYVWLSVFFMMIRVVGYVLIGYSFAAGLSSLIQHETISIGRLFLILLVGIGLKVGALIIATRLQAKIITEVKSNIRQAMVEKVLKVGLKYQNFTSTSSMINLASDTIEQLENYYGRFLSEFYGTFAMSSVLFVAFLFLNVKVAFIFLVLSPIIPLFLKFMLKMVTSKQTKYWRKYQDVGQLFLDSLQGIVTLKIFNADQKRSEELNRRAELFRNETMKILAMQLNSITLIEWIAYGGSVTCILVAWHEMAQGSVSLFAMIMILFLAMEAFKPMIVLTSSFHVAMTGVAAGHQLVDFFNLNETKNQTDRLITELQPISIQNLSYWYPNNKENTLKEITMQFKAIGLVAIVGPSGCGKSTLAKLIASQLDGPFGLYYGRFAYQDYNVQSLQTNILRITHNNYIFEGTIRDNLQLGNPNASDMVYIEALKKVGLYHELVTRGGLEMVLYPEAKNLSGGQKQRLALARALLYDAWVYLFDEATSNIDVESETIILKVIAELAKTKQVIVISHRLKSIEQADYIYVMERGKVVEAGKHYQLMNQQGLYQDMVQAQSFFEEATDEN